MEAAVLCETFDRDDGVTVHLRSEYEAGAHELPVQQHGARAALALLAGVLRAREAEALAQREQQAFAFPEVGFAALAVDAERNPHTRQRSSARLVRTVSAWRR
jgi:hypothetical protein